MVELIIIVALSVAFFTMAWFSTSLVFMSYEVVEESLGTIMFHFKWYPQWKQRIWDEEAFKAAGGVLLYVVWTVTIGALFLTGMSIIAMPLMLNGNYITDFAFVIYNIAAIVISQYIGYKVGDAAELWHLRHVANQDYDYYCEIPPYMEYGEKRGLQAGISSYYAFLVLEVVVLFIIG